MTAHGLVLFCFAYVLATATPGPGIAALLARTLSRGSRGLPAFIAGYVVGDLIWLDVEADGFLYNMVRAIAGTLLNVGRGYWPETQVATILQAEDRTVAGPTAPAQGLFLMRVSYDG